MKKILVPCDFSEPSIQAFKFAVEIASQSDGEVVLLNVIELPVMHDTVLMPTLSFEEAFMKDMKESAEKNFEKMKIKWAKEGPKITSLVSFGPVNFTIREFIEKKKIDLVVMGTHGAAGLKEFFIGSNTEKIVRTSPVPVIAVKKSVKASSIRNIVLAIVPNAELDALVKKVKELQSFFKATLHVVYINTPASFKRDLEVLIQLRDFAKRYALKDYTISIYNDFNEEEGVRNFAQEKKADMVALGTHGRRGLSHFMSGSVTEDVVNHIDCPIWTSSLK